MQFAFADISAGDHQVVPVNTIIMKNSSRIRNSASLMAATNQTLSHLRDLIRHNRVTLVCRVAADVISHPSCRSYQFTASPLLNEGQILL